MKTVYLLWMLVLSILSVDGFAQIRSGTVELPSGMVVSSSWQNRIGLESKASAEIGYLLHGVASDDGKQQMNGADIYPGVRWLMPFDDAVKALGLNQRPSSSGKLASSILPQGSFYFANYDGLFDGEFSHLTIVTDSARQVVCVQLEELAPKFVGTLYESRNEGSVFNFLTMGRRAVPTLQIDHNLAYQNRSGWTSVSKGSSSSDQLKASLFRLDTVLFDPRGMIVPSSSLRRPKALRKVRWYIPEPLAALILQYISVQTAK